MDVCGTVATVKRSTTRDKVTRFTARAGNSGLSLVLGSQPVHFQHSPLSVVSLLSPVSPVGEDRHAGPPVRGTRPTPGPSRVVPGVDF